MGVWKDKSKPKNINNVIMLHSNLHIVARQQKNIAKKLLCIWVVTMVTRNGFLM